METDCRRGTPLSGEPSEPLDDPRVTEALEEYLAALEAGQRPDRRAFLARYADVASALEGCLQSLDVLHATVPQLVPPPSVVPPPAEVPTDASPLGDFRILHEVGRGGMGVVYEAVQLSLGRRVALKVLPFASALDARHLRRFQNEAQAAAHLHHSHIVPVFAVGCERGVYYYAMQFIEGRTVAAYIQELRQQAGLDAVVGKKDGETERRRERETILTSVSHSLRLSVSHSATAGGDGNFYRTIARLGVQAAEALEHAHQQGIVHRDVKPANLLLDAKEHLWVTDFGLARCQNDAGITATGDVVGTLRYMSPEQALARHGLVDHRTDIYSLGATLYELLTLEPVFPGSDRQELLKHIAFDEPRPPRAVRRSIPRELETIVLKALGKTPEERYASAQELANDLRRFLEDRPVLARRPTRIEKGLKWLRRHRGVAVAAVAGLFLAAVGLAASTVLIAQEQARTRQAYEAEAAQRARAEENFRQARRAVDYFALVCEDDMADRPEMQGVRRKLLEGARQYYQEFIDQHQDDPDIQGELAASHMRVGRILDEIGSRADALASVERAREIQEKLVRDHPADPDFERGLSSIYHTLGQMRSGSRVPLLTQKSVQDDLKVGDDQMKQIAPLVDARKEAFREFRHRSPEEWRRKLDELGQQEKVLDGILTPEQSLRLKQIALQQRGSLAFNEPEVANELGLTAAQKTKVQLIQEEASNALNDPARFGPRRDWKKTEDWGKALKEQLLAVLTDEQKSKWKEMTGEPFKGEIRRTFFGGHGPPPPSGDPHRKHSP